MEERKSGLRLMVYDRTCGGPWGLPGLTFSWRAGGQGPHRALWSRPGEPNTITCFHGRVPPGF